MGKEIEIKLMLEPVDSTHGTLSSSKLSEIQAAIRGVEALKVLQEEDLALLNLYYDTPKQDLYRHGIALRVRRTGEDYEMTIKTRPQARNAGLHIHPEYNISLKACPKTPVLSLFPHEIFLGIEADGFTLQSLSSQIYNHMGQECKRHIMLLAVNEPESKGLVELSLDEVTYKGKNGAVFGAELELELKEGEPELLRLMLGSILDKLASEVPDVLVRAGGMSKMQRSAVYAGLSPVPLCDIEKIVDADTLWTSLADLEAEAFMGEDLSLSPKFKAFEEMIGKIPETDTKAADALKTLADELQTIQSHPENEQRELFRRVLGSPEFVKARIDRAINKL